MTDLRPRNTSARETRNVTIRLGADVEGEWTFISNRVDHPFETRYTMAYRISLSDDAVLFDRHGRLAQMRVYVNITEQDNERPSFLATRGTIRVNRLYDGTIESYEAEADFGERTPVNASSKRGAAEALVSEQADAWLRSQVLAAVRRGNKVAK